MKVIEKVASEDILTLDIETVRLYEELKDAPLEMQSAWENKIKHEGKIPDFIELSELWKMKAPLYAEFSKVCAVSMSYLTKEGTLKVKTYFGIDEVEILKSLYSDLALFLTHNRSYRLLGHASKFFDYPYLCKRYIVNSLDIPSVIDESHCKPWEMKNMDTNELWRSFGTGAGSSLQALCCVLNVPTSKVDLVGDEVGEAYYGGELLRIATYCSKDVVSTFNCFRKFKKQAIFQFDEVEYIFQEGEGAKRKVNVLEHVLASGQLTSSVVSAIVLYTEEEKLDKEEVLILIKTALAKSKDYQKVNEEDFAELKTALGLDVDYSLIKIVVDKGNLAKLQVTALLKLYGNSTDEIKAEVIELTEKYLIEYGKIGQVTAKNSLLFLKQNLT
jgi:hypothetical protein